MSDPKYTYTFKQHDETVRLEPVTISSRLILQAAEKSGIAWKIIPNTKIIKLEFKGIKKYFKFQISSETKSVAFLSCHNKATTAALLIRAGASVPRGLTLSRENSQTDRREVFNKLKKPLVVKPATGKQGDAVFLKIDNMDEYLEAVAATFEYSDDRKLKVMVEEYFVGTEYRVVATQDKVLAIAYRMPANVIGDGEKTIKQLIDLKNSDPRRGENHSKSLTKIKIDEDLLKNLSDQSLALKSVLEKGQHVALRKVSNISKGGDSIDMTDQAHPSVKEIILRAIQAIPGLAIGGVDFMTTDITKLQTPDTYQIIEINSSPGLRMHISPYQGKPRPIHFEFIKLSFPEIEIPKV